MEQIQAEKKGQSPSGCEVGVEGKKPDWLLTRAMAISTTESSRGSPAYEPMPTSPGEFHNAIPHLICALLTLA